MKYGDEHDDVLHILHVHGPCFTTPFIYFTSFSIFCDVMSNSLLTTIVQDWYKSVFRIEVPEPYPLSNGGQKWAH